MLEERCLSWVGRTAPKESVVDVRRLADRGVAGPPLTADQIVAYYEAYHRNRPHFPDPVEVLELLDRYLQPGVRCVDIGCGDGEPVGVRAKQRGCEYVGVDIATEAIRKTAARGLDARLVRDSSSLPFEDGTFEVGFLLEVLEHLFDPQATLEEVRRVLVPYGVLVVTTPNVAYWKRRFDLALRGRWNPYGYSRAVEEPWADPHIRFFNPGALRRLLVKAGYTVEHVGGHSGSLIGDMPLLGRMFFPDGSRASPTYRRLEARAPGLLGCFLHAVAIKP
jgi:SAM-dependent methyltransferase